MAFSAGKSREFAKVMAASAAMIVAGACVASARAQDAEQTSTAPPPSHSLVLINQIQNLRDQMQQMQGQIEELQHELQQLQQTSKDQYIDLDSRLGKLERPQAAPAASSSVVPPASAKAVAPTSAPLAKTMSPADQAAAQADFDAAFKSLRGGNYVDSARGFRAFIDKYPQSPLVANAYYWLGGSYYVTQNYKPAMAAFQALLKQFPNNSKAPEAQLRLADCQIALKDYPAARATLETVIKAHPHTQLAQRARDRMQDLPAAAGTQ